MAALLKRRVALLIALVAVSAGGTAVALGAGTGTPARPHRPQAARRSHHGVLAAASSYLGLSRAQLLSDLGSGKTLGEIAAATPGKSESGLVAALVAAARSRLHASEAQLPARIDALVHGNARSPHPHARRGLLRGAVLGYLATDRGTLAAELRSGKTLEQIADATPGKSAAGLREAVLAALKKRLDAEVGAGRVAKSGEARRLARLEARVEQLLSRTDRPTLAAHGH
jgi:hypothetical protein